LDRESQAFSLRAGQPAPPLHLIIKATPV